MDLGLGFGAEIGFITGLGLASGVSGRISVVWGDGFGEGVAKAKVSAGAGGGAGGGGGGGGGGLRRVASRSGSGLTFALPDCADRLVFGESFTTSTITSGWAVGVGFTKKGQPIIVAVTTNR